MKLKSINNKNKKASIYDPIMVGAFILSIAITIFVMMVFWYAFDDSMREVVADSPGNESVVETLETIKEEG